MNPSAAAFALILQQRQQLQQQGHGNLAGQGHANQSASGAASHFSHQLGAAGPRGSNPAPNPYVNTPTPTPAPPTPTTATPGMQSWFCEPCDKEFSAVTAFDAHVATHEACPHPGCPFSATKKAVSAHFHGAHGLYAGTGFKTIDVEGQRFRVLLGTSPEEVSQWRADRKRKFPTAESEQSKSQQLQELEEAGGVHLVDKRRRRDPEGRGGRDKGDKSRDRRREGEAVAGASAGAWKKPQSAPDPNQEGEIPTASSAMEGAEEAKGAEVMEGTKGAAEVEGAETAEDTGGMGDTGTGDRRRRCIHFARGRCTAAPGACSYSHDFTPRVCEFFVRGFCKRGNRCLCVHDRAARADGRADKAPDGVEGGDVGGGIGGSGTGAPGRDPDRPRTARGELYLPSPLEGGKRGTLWGNLLKDAAQREENVVLQCLRLLVKGDFLQKA
ncbi:hypothetical protein B484DRAFT_405212 [Ochromonadaceae sp. CCMP2298]|nr:hypothetical protein B484DRAFT_405212 [Ochromonadaceae sp. CCMP2298]